MLATYSLAYFGAISKRLSRPAMFLSRLLLSVFLVACISPLAVAQAEFSKLIVFGDSLSDTGNLAIINFPPPYFENRISDGPVVADIIAESIGSDAQASGHLLGRADGFNYAVAGGNIMGAEPEDLPQQVSAYLQRVTDQADPDALYLVFVGGNDLRDLRSRSSLAQAQLEINQTLSSLDTQIRRLRDAGARAFLIPNVANIGRIPETLDREANDPGIAARAETYTRAYNQSLSQVLAAFDSDKGTVIAEFDLFSAFESLINNASDFGFTNTREGCFDPDEFEIATECLLFGFGTRVFFDRIHPSSASNQIIASQMIDAIPSLPNSETPRVVIAPILQLLLFD